MSMCACLCVHALYTYNMQLRNYIMNACTCVILPILCKYNWICISWHNYIMCVLPFTNVSLSVQARLKKTNELVALKIIKIEPSKSMSMQHCSSVHALPLH